ncbi:MAG: hypothetical protein ACTSQD_02160 [Promethearchaeota archaeon]
MVFFQLDTTRIIQVYVLQGIIAAFFLYLAYKVLKRDTKRLNLMFSLGFIFAASGILINFIYAPLTNEAVVIVLYYITIFVMFLFGAFFVIFVLMLLKSEKVITPKKQAIYIIIYFVAELCSVFIPDGVTINASTEWKPVWSVAMFIYFVSVIRTIWSLIALIFVIASPLLMYYGVGRQIEK